MPLLFNVTRDNNTFRLYFPSVRDQTGWVRPNPLHMLTDYDTLIKVTVFNYDLLNKDFVEYAKSRGCMNGAGKPSPIDPDYVDEPFDLTYEAPTRKNHDPFAIRRYVRCHWLSKDVFLAAKEKIYTDAQNDKKPKLFSIKDKEAFWPSIMPARSRLQDCWEIYLVNFCGAVVSDFSCVPKALPIPGLGKSKSQIKNHIEILPL